MTKYLELNSIRKVLKPLCANNSKLPHLVKRGIKKAIRIMESMAREPVTIYTIWVCEKLEPLIYESGKDSGFNDYGSNCVMGWYTNYDWCKTELHHNSLDMFETCYHYACVEKCEEGIQRPGIAVQWFKYDPERDGYFEIPTPDRETNICSRSF